MCMMNNTLKVLYDKLLNLICCNKYNKGYKFVKYEDDTICHNNILYDMTNINFTPSITEDRQWRTCDLYEDTQEKND
jgi:hypothetical protein